MLFYSTVMSRTYLSPHSQISLLHKVYPHARSMYRHKRRHLQPGLSPDCMLNKLGDGRLGPVPFRPYAEPGEPCHRVSPAQPPVNVLGPKSVSARRAKGLMRHPPTRPWASLPEPVLPHIRYTRFRPCRQARVSILSAGRRALCRWRSPSPGKCERWRMSPWPYSPESSGASPLHIPFIRTALCANG